MRGTLYAFRGAPASGKGTITEAFIKTLPGKIAFLELDTFRWGFHLCNREIADITADEHQLAYTNFLNVLENYLKDGTYTIVCEGLFSWDVPSTHGNMQDILVLASKYNFTTHPILLHAGYDLLWERNLARPYSVPKHEFDMLHHHVMQKISEHEIQIDVGQRSVEEIVSTLNYL